MWNQLKTVLLLGVLSAMVIAMGGALGPRALPWAVGFAVVMNVVSWFFSDRIVLAMHGAQQVGPEQAPELHRIVAELSQKAGIPMPRVFVIDDPQPNAFATGRNPAHGVVAVTTGILRLLSTRELRGVIGHELGHIAHRDILVASVAALAASAISGIAQMIQWSVLFGGGSRDEREEGSSLGRSLLVALVAPIAATMVQLGISRSREYLADAKGAELTGDPEALASALERLHLGAERIPTSHPQPATASLFIVNPLAGASRLFALFSTHPPMEERIRRLRAMRLETTTAAPRLAW